MDVALDGGFERASLRFASKKDQPQLAPALRAIYTAPTKAAAEQALAELEASPLDQRYPAIARTWRSAWPEFVQFLTFPRNYVGSFTART
jgi:transposase-like protein